MVDNGTVAASGEPGSDEICGGNVERVPCGPQLGAACRPRGDVSLAELQEHFASLQQEFEQFKEGRCRPPSQVGKAPLTNLQPAALGQRLGGPPVTSTGGVEPPHAQLAQAGPDTQRSYSPVPGRRREGRAQEPPRSRRTPSPLPPQQPPIGGPLRAQRAPSPHAPPGAGVQRFKAQPLELRQSSPRPGQMPLSAGRVREPEVASHVAQQQQQHQKPQPQKRQKKKSDRPPWRDDFVERASPWDQELAQEAAAAQNGGRKEARAQGAVPTAVAARAPESGRAVGSKGPNRKWGSEGGGSNVNGRDGETAGGPQGAPGGSPQGQKAGAGEHPAKRRGPSSAINRARAAVVAAAMEAAQQHIQHEQVATRGGMMLVIPPGPPSPDPEQPPPQQPEQHAGAQNSARRSPTRMSLIPSPTSDSRPPELRHRSQASRIPHTPRSQDREPSPDPQTARDRWHPAPPAAAIRQSPPRQGPQPPAASPAVCATARSADDSSVLETAPGPSSGYTANPQRRRRQWEVPGAGASGGSSGGGGDSAGGDCGGGTLLNGPAASARRLMGSRHMSENGDAPVEATVAGFLPDVPPAEYSRPTAGPLAPLQRATAVGDSGSGGGSSSGGGGAPVPVLQPVPPACRPPSRPNSRPGSRSASRTPSNNGSAQPEPLIQLGLPPCKRTSSHTGYADGYGSSGGGSGAACGDLVADSVLTDGVAEPLTVPTPHELPKSRRGSWGQAPAPPIVISGVGPLPIGSTGGSMGVLQASSAGGGETPRSGAGPLTHRDRAEYLRKLSALKRPAPHESVRRLTEDGALAVGMAAGSSGGGSNSSGGGSASHSRKWMDPVCGDTPLSAAPVEAVGSAPAAVRAARNRGHSADVYSSIGDASGGGVSGGGNSSAAPARPAGPQRGRSQQELTRTNLDQAPADKAEVLHPEHPVERPPSPQATSRMRPLAPLQVPKGPDVSPGPSPPSTSPVPEQGPRQGGPPAGGQPPVQVGGAISTEQYMAFAVQNPEVAVAAAQAALNANPGRARARWNLPPEQPQGPATAAVAPAPPPWVQQPGRQQLQQQPQPYTWQPPGQPQPPPPLQPHQQPHHPQQPHQQSHQPLAAAMIAATGTLNATGPSVPLPLPHRAHQLPHSAPAHHEPQDLRRVASEGQRTHVGARPLGYPFPPDMQPPLGMGLPPGSAPGFGAHVGANPRPPPPLPPPPMVQGLFPGAPVGGNMSGGGGGFPGAAPPWHGLGDGSLDGGSGRLAAFVNGGGQYPSALHPIRPVIAAPGEPWPPGAGPPLPPPPGPLHLQPPLPQGHPPPNWNGNAYMPIPRSASYYGSSAGGGAGLPGGSEAFSSSGPVVAAGGPMDAYKPAQPFRRISNGPSEGYGSPGPSYMPPPLPGPGFAGPSGPPGPPAGSGPMSSPGGDLPDYLRVSMSRMVAGWSAPNAKHGALSGFNDVWQHRNNRMSPPPGHYNGGPQGQLQGPPGMPPQGSSGSMGGYGGGGLPPPAQGAMSNGVGQGAMSNGVGRMGPGGMGGSGGGAEGSGTSSSGSRVRETGFEGLSLAEVLASKPKKEPPPYIKKTESSGGGGSSGGKCEGG